MKSFIIQKYMEKPLLYNKRKFDIRSFVLVNVNNNIMKAYWYQEFYIRTSSVNYVLENLDNRMIHLTNDSVQKKGEEYGRFEDGNKVSMQDFQKFID